MSPGRERSPETPGRQTKTTTEFSMSKFAKFSAGPQPKPKITKTTPKGNIFIDYKDVENLRRTMSPNGKIFARKRNSTSAQEQRLLAQAIKRARFMALLPYTSATL